MTKTVWVGKNKNQVPIVKPSIPVYEDGNYVDDAYEFDFRSGMNVTHAGFGKMQITASGSSGSGELRENAAAGDTSITVLDVPSYVVVDQYVVIDPFTNECEVRKISSITENVLTLTSNYTGYPVSASALLYSHSIGDAVIFVENDVINARWFGAKGDGATDDAANLHLALYAAKKTDSLKLHIPTGTYIWEDLEGTLWNGGIHGLNYEEWVSLEIFGDGIGKTILKLGDNQTWTGNKQFVYMPGRKQIIRDISFTAGPGMNYTADSHAFDVIDLTEGAVNYCLQSQVKNIEIYNIIGGTAGAGGVGVGSYNTWSFHEVDTTLASEVTAPGSVVVTPASMDGIRRGQRLLIKWASTTSIDEEVIVSWVDTDAGTFTASFANTHAIGERIVAYTQSATHCLIENVYVHDCHQLTAYGAGSNGNTWRRCRAISGSGSANCHGFYNSGGYNLFEDCWVEGWCGYHFHNYKAVARRDQAGDKFINCTSINPGFMHMINQGTANSTPNPYNTDFVVDALLDRYLLVKNCTFRHSNGYIVAGIKIDYPTIVEGCVFDDAYGGSGAGIIDAFNYSYHSPCIVKNNYFKFTNEPFGSANFYCVRAANVIVEGNIIDNATRATGVVGIYTIEDSIVKGNILFNSSLLPGGKTIAEGNKVINTVSYNPLSLQDSTNLVVRANHFESTSGLLCFSNLTNVAGILEDNDFAGLNCKYSTAINAGFRWRNNCGSFGAGSYATELTRESGSLKMFTADGTVNYRRCVELSGLTVSECETSDTGFIGVAVMTAATGGAVMIVMDSGAEVEIDCDDAWTAGNLARLSTSAGGKVHDVGATGDVRAIVGMFLDSGIAAGAATVRLI